MSHPLEGALTYIGTKVVHARPMGLGEYNTYRGWVIPADEDPAAPGYLIEYTDGGKPNDDRHAGYISWSPADVFEATYQEMYKAQQDLTFQQDLPALHQENFTFSSALAALKDGKKIARSGWNGKGMYLYLVPENRYAPTTEAGHAIAKHHDDGLVPYGAYIAMKTAQENVVPWLASQTDVLADDWQVLA